MFINECEGMTTLETRRIRADMLEVYKILKGFEGTDELKFFQRKVGSRLQEGMI